MATALTSPASLTSPAFRRTLATEIRLFLREPWAALFGILFPTALLLALGAIPILREPSPEFGGARFVDIWAPTALVLGIGIFTLQHVPTVVATYRERGILRRMSTTPVPPATLLLAQLLVAMMATVTAAVILIVSAWLILDVPLPAYPGWFVIAFVVGVGSLLAIGLLLAAVAPTAKAASGLTTVVWMVTMFLSGVFLPRVFFPTPLQRIGDYTPPGVQAILNSWSADAAVAAAVGGTSGPPQLLPLGIMLVIAVVAGAMAARLFRWE